MQSEKDEFVKTQDHQDPHAPPAPVDYQKLLNLFRSYRFGRMAYINKFILIELLLSGISLMWHGSSAIPLLGTYFVFRGLGAVLSHLTKHVQNIRDSRKVVKGYVGLISIALGLVLGAGFGYFLFSSMALAMTLVPSIVLGLQYAGCLILANSVMSRLTKSLVLKIGVGIALVIGLHHIAMPVLLSLPIGAALSCALVGAAVFGLVSKHVLRLAYYLKYGVSNADGLYLDGSLDQRAQAQAEQLGVSKEAIVKLVQLIVQDLKAVKQNSGYYDWFMERRQAMTDALKDQLELVITTKFDAQSLPMIQTILAPPAFELWFYIEAVAWGHFVGENYPTVLRTEELSAEQHLAVGSAGSNIFFATEVGLNVKMAYHDYWLGCAYHLLRKDQQGEQNFLAASRRFFDEFNRSHNRDKINVVDTESEASDLSSSESNTFRNDVN